jgi:prolipoprotein diacylglyceryl transferase
MLVHPNFDPVAISVFGLDVHWYGLTYVAGFLSCYVLWVYRVRRYSHLQGSIWNSESISDLIFYGALGAVIGGRIGYILFYKPAEYLANPLAILQVWEGGMSFHGGLLGVIVALTLFAQRHKVTFFDITDFVAPVAPIGLFWGRIGNFINQELWGKTTDVPWGMVFTNGGPLPRHPSMLYEAVLEGLVLLAISWWLARKPRPSGFLSGVFLVGYASARIVVEFVRVPDEHLNYLLFDWVTMGQVLSLPMLLLGLLLIFRPLKKG